MTIDPSETDPWLGGEPTLSDQPATAASPRPGDRLPDEEMPDDPSASEGGPGTWRLFVAVALPQAVRESIAELGTRVDARVRDRVRWTPAGNIHVTLQFLGDIETGHVQKLADCLSETASNSSAMTVAAGKTGAFPLFRNPKILWVGVDGETKRLEQLQGRVEGGLARLGYEPERRKWTAHATVGRVLRGMNGKQAADLGFAWKRMVGPRNFEKFTVDTVTLFRSRLQSGGPIYETVQEFKLGD